MCVKQDLRKIGRLCRLLRDKNETFERKLGLAQEATSTLKESLIVPAGLQSSACGNRHVQGIYAKLILEWVYGILVRSGVRSKGNVYLQNDARCWNLLSSLLELPVLEESYPSPPLGLAAAVATAAKDGGPSLGDAISRFLELQAKIDWHLSLEHACTMLQTVLQASQDTVHGDRWMLAGAHCAVLMRHIAAGHPNSRKVFTSLVEKDMLTCLLEAAFIARTDPCQESSPCQTLKTQVQELISSALLTPQNTAIVADHADFIFSATTDTDERDKSQLSYHWLLCESLKQLMMNGITKGHVIATSLPHVLDILCKSLQRNRIAIIQESNSESRLALSSTENGRHLQRGFSLFAWMAGVLISCTEDVESCRAAPYLLRSAAGLLNEARESSLYQPTQDHSGSQLMCLRKFANAMIGMVTGASDNSTKAAAAQFSTAIIQLEHRALQPLLEAVWPMLWHLAVDDTLFPAAEGSTNNLSTGIVISSKAAISICHAYSELRQITWMLQSLCSAMSSSTDPESTICALVSNQDFLRELRKAVQTLHAGLAVPLLHWIDGQGANDSDMLEGNSYSQNLLRLMCIQGIRVDLATAASVARALQKILHGNIGKILFSLLQQCMDNEMKQTDIRNLCIMLSLHRSLLELHANCSLMHPDVARLPGHDIHSDAEHKPVLDGYFSSIQPPGELSQSMEFCLATLITQVCASCSGKAQDKDQNLDLLYELILTAGQRVQVLSALLQKVRFDCPTITTREGRLDFSVTSCGDSDSLLVSELQKLASSFAEALVFSNSLQISCNCCNTATDAVDLLDVLLQDTAWVQWAPKSALSEFARSVLQKFSDGKISKLSVAELIQQHCSQVNSDVWVTNFAQIMAKHLQLILQQHNILPVPCPSGGERLDLLRDPALLAFQKPLLSEREGRFCQDFMSGLAAYAEVFGNLNFQDSSNSKNIGKCPNLSVLCALLDLCHCFGEIQHFKSSDKRHLLFMLAHLEICVGQAVAANLSRSHLYAARDVKALFCSIISASRKAGAKLSASDASATESDVKLLEWMFRSATLFESSANALEQKADLSNVTCDTGAMIEATAQTARHIFVSLFSSGFSIACVNLAEKMTDSELPHTPAYSTEVGEALVPIVLLEAFMLAVGDLQTTQLQSREQLARFIELSVDKVFHFTIGKTKCKNSYLLSAAGAAGATLHAAMHVFPMDVHKSLQSNNISQHTANAVDTLVSLLSVKYPVQEIRHASLASNFGVRLAGFVQSATHWFRYCQTQQTGHTVETGKMANIKQIALLHIFCLAEIDQQNKIDKRNDGWETPTSVHAAMLMSFRSLTQIANEKSRFDITETLGSILASPVSLQCGCAALACIESCMLAERSTLNWNGLLSGSGAAAEQLASAVLGFCDVLLSGSKRNLASGIINNSMAASITVFECILSRERTSRLSTLKVSRCLALAGAVLQRVLDHPNLESSAENLEVISSCRLLASALRHRPNETRRSMVLVKICISRMMLILSKMIHVLHIESPECEDEHRINHGFEPPQDRLAHFHKLLPAEQNLHAKASVLQLASGINDVLLELSSQKMSASKYCVLILAEYLKFLSTSVRPNQQRMQTQQEGNRQIDGPGIFRSASVDGSSMAQQVEAALQLGAMAVYGVCSKHEIQHLYAALGHQSCGTKRHALEELRHNYEKKFKYSGKV